MTASEHLLVLFSIVLGLGMTELLSSVHHLLHPRTTVKWHWLPLVWAAIVFIAVVQLWWAMFEFGRTSDVPNFFELLLTILSPVMLYLVATSVLPDVAPGEEICARIGVVAPTDYGLLNQTLIGCPEPAASFERVASALLRSNIRVEKIGGERLRLVSEAGTIELRRAI